MDAEVAPSLDLSDRRRLHLVAAGGAAMSAIATFLRELGHDVTGCDARDSSTLQALRTAGLDVWVGHDPAHIRAETDYVIASSALRSDNPELVAARALGIPVLWRGDAMAAVVATRPRVAVVSGTHGKTTTTSMLAAILTAAGWHPSWFIGGTPIGGRASCYDTGGDWIVVEGDESDHTFLQFRRDAAIVTNVEADHLDRWGDDLANLRAGFAEFVAATTGPVVLCRDDPGAADLVSIRPDAITYGAHAAADYQGRGYEATRDGCVLHVVHRRTGELAPIELALRGRDMAQNALGAAALATELGVDWTVVVAALAGFRGVARRFQHRGSIGGVDLYDDYAHTATEVAATLARAREGPWRRVIAVYQPHRFTRISRHWRDFAEAFVDADRVVVTALDGAFEAPVDGVDARLVLHAVIDAHPATDMAYLPEWSALADVPRRDARPGDVVITLGCGTITEIHDEWSAGTGARR